MKASESLFSQILNSLFRALMSFYDSTPLGRILSWISSDLSIIDLDVPFSLLFSIGSTTTAYANLGVLAVITWQVLFVSILVRYLAMQLQVFVARRNVYTVEEIDEVREQWVKIFRKEYLVS